MQLSVIAPIIGSVVLSSSAQVLLKAGVSTPAIRMAFADSGNRIGIALALLTSPLVLLGLAVFGLSAIVWLFVLSKIAVSHAYPFVALGIVMTVAAGRIMFGEPFSALSLIGVALIVSGVLTLAVS
jgi:multidrug transporter EmrE-like cation transporter